MKIASQATSEGLADHGLSTTVINGRLLGHLAPLYLALGSNR